MVSRAVAPTDATKLTSSATGSHPRHDRMGPLTTYAMHPDGLRFETQEEQEEVILFLREHLIVLFPTVVLGFVMIIAPTILFPLFFRFLSLPIAVPTGYLIVGTVFWYVVTFGFLLARFLRWFFNIYIVTNERVVDIDFVNLLYKEFSEARLAKIQDLSFNAKGIFAAIFNYGSVHIQTAGEMPNFVFEKVSNPEQIVKTISEAAEKAKLL